MSVATLERYSGQLCETGGMGWSGLFRLTKQTRQTEQTKNGLLALADFFSTLLLGDIVENGGFNGGQWRGLAWRARKNDR